MNSFLDIFLIDKINLFMGISSVILGIIFLILSCVLGYKKIKNNKLFKQIDCVLEYKICEVLNFFFSSILLLSFCFIKYFYFSKMDKVLDSFLVLLGVIFVNIFFKIFCILNKTSERKEIIKNLFLRIIDNYVLIMTIVLCSSIIATQIPIVDISKFFGANVSRFSLINLPFLLSGLFIVASSVSILFQYIISKTEQKNKTNINDILKVFLPIIIMLITKILYPLSYNIFMVVSIGILSKYITEKLSTYFNQRIIHGKKDNTLGLNFLNQASNIFFSSLVNLSIMVVLIFICLTSSGFFGLTLASIGIISSTIATSNINIFEKNSESYKYIAKTINNIAFFYIFFETLEFIYKTQIDINIFSDNVIIGLFISLALFIFNILKIINLAKYVQLSKKHIYIAVRTLIYITVFVSCFYYLLPFVNYELLGAVVMGLILITSLVSILVVNGIDVFTNQNSKNQFVIHLLKNTVLPLINQLTTILIIVIVLLLPIIK